MSKKKGSPVADMFEGERFFWWGEAEPAALIKDTLKNASVEQAIKGLSGFTMANDVSVENVEGRDHPGAGASTLALIFYASRYNGLAMTWDLNGARGSLLRTIFTETLGNYFRNILRIIEGKADLP